MALYWCFDKLIDVLKRFIINRSKSRWNMISLKENPKILIDSSWEIVISKAHTWNKILKKDVGKDRIKFTQSNGNVLSNFKCTYSNWLQNACISKKRLIKYKLEYDIN